MYMYCRLMQIVNALKTELYGSYMGNLLLLLLLSDDKPDYC